MNGDFQRHLPGQGMRGTAEAWVVSTEGHFDHIQQAFIDIAILDQIISGLFDGHGDGGVVVGGADNQIDLGHHAPLIGPVMMGERATRCLDNAHAFGGGVGRDGMEIG